MDMGIVSKEALLNTDNSHARNKNKLAKMVKNYTPSPTAYKENIETISVFDAFNFKIALKERGYFYNGVDKSWVKETPTAEVNDELEYLKTLGLTNVTVQKSAGVAVRSRKSVQLYGNLYDLPSKRQLLKEKGYSWNNSLKCWAKPVEEFDIKAEVAFLKSNFPKDCYVKVK